MSILMFFVNLSLVIMGAGLILFIMFIAMCLALCPKED